MRKPVFDICDQQRRRSVPLLFAAWIVQVSLVSISKMSSLYLAFLAEQACFESYLGADPKDRFSCDGAHLQS